ncbi:MAG: heavy-metal-associated domain-containing protein [Dactylosporangium sp.]|nr:heavy-metal-associated domain-containing protein [Dactylosporangium sp.]NNJ63783.1 heavy-metal-associated domain-containing protein [Dactylosporangium sp.]
MESRYTVKGMTCGHCAQAVKQEIGKLPGVTEVSVALDTGTVTVSAERAPERAAVRTAVDDAGYELLDD